MTGTLLAADLLAARWPQLVDLVPEHYDLERLAEGRRLVLYLCENDLDGRSTSLRFTREAEKSVVYWFDGPFSFALVAELERPELLPIAVRGRCARSVPVPAAYWPAAGPVVCCGYSSPRSARPAHRAGCFPIVHPG